MNVLTVKAPVTTTVTLMLDTPTKITYETLQEKREIMGLLFKGCSSLRPKVNSLVIEFIKTACGRGRRYCECRDFINIMHGKLGRRTAGPFENNLYGSSTWMGVKIPGQHPGILRTQCFQLTNGHYVALEYAP